MTSISNGILSHPAQTVDRRERVQGKPHRIAAVIGITVSSLVAAEGLGCRPPTPAEQAWMDANMIVTEQVALNRTAIDRINAERAGRGLAPLDLSPAIDGSEVSGCTADDRNVMIKAGAWEPRAMAPTPLPAAVDNSTLDAFPPVGDQGDNGTCSCYSTTYYTMTYMVARARGINAKSGGNATRYSPKFCYNLINNGEDNGSTVSSAYAVQQNHGVPTLAVWPYDDDFREWPLTASVWRSAISARMGQSGKVTSVDRPSGLDNLKRLLANGYLLNYQTNIYGWQYGTVGNDPSTTADNGLVGQKIAKWGKDDVSGHAMTIVGYNDHIWVDTNGNGSVDEAEKGALRVVNSWGTNWSNGNGGFCWVSYDALRGVSTIPSWSGGTNRMPKFFWMNEVYWINARPVHSPSLLAEVTLSTAKRNQVTLRGGRSETSATTPGSTASSNLAGAGGPYSLNGTSTAVAATIVLDLSDLVQSGSKRYYAQIIDSATSNPTSVTAVRLTDAAGNDLGGSLTTSPAGGLPRSADGSTLLAWFDRAISDTTAPAVISDLAATLEAPTSVTLSWTAPGDDGTSGSATSYDVRWSTGAVASGWSGASQGTGEPTPAQTGTTQTFAVSGLTAGTTYTFAITATDEAGNTSSLSNVLTITTPLSLAITTGATLPSAGAGSPFSITLAKTGGTGAVTWSPVIDFAESGQGSGANLSGGTAKNWKANGGRWIYTFPAGFTFPFLGTERTWVSVTSNGLLDFSGEVSTATGTDALMTTNPLIAVFWDYLLTNGSAQTNEDIYITEASDRVTIRWQAEKWSTRIPVNAQAVLYRDGRILLEYGTAITGVGNQFVGVSGSAGPSYSTLHKATSIAADVRRLFTPSTIPSGLAVNPATGFLSGSLATAGTYSFSIAATDSGYPAQVVSKAFTLTVSAAANHPPQISAQASAGPAEVALP